jgi:aspartate oxidase
MSIENVVETDVLVIGGGIAGCFAAIKAKEQGADVTPKLPLPNISVFFTQTLATT